MLLEVKNLKVYYDKVEALKGISINVDAGKIVAIIGANGAGKTTLTKTVMGLQAAKEGEIWFQGHQINGYPAHGRVKQGMRLVPEGRRLFPDMTVMDNLLCAAHLERDKKILTDTLEGIFVHFPILKARRKQNAGSLSGGEQQMLAIARALIGHPTLLLLDEPTLGLSPIMCQEVREIIKSIHTESLGIFLAEQNARMALQIADTAYVLENGVIQLAGKSEDLVKNPLVKKIYFGG